MNDNIFSTLDVREKYLLAIYTLFSAEGSDIRLVINAMSKLTGKPFADLKMTVGVLTGKGLMLACASLAKMGILHSTDDEDKDEATATAALITKVT